MSLKNIMNQTIIVKPSPSHHNRVTLSKNITSNYEFMFTDLLPFIKIKWKAINFTQVHSSYDIKYSLFFYKYTNTLNNKYYMQ